MRTRTHRSFTVSEIGLGCYGLSGAYGPPDVAAYTQALRRGYELGVTFYDTAPAYASGVADAERVLGEAVAPFRDEVAIATKIGVKESAAADLTREIIVASCEESLRRLGTDRIDLYQIHYDDPATPVPAIIDTLEGLKQAGKIRHYGLGHLSPERSADFLAAGDVLSILMELSAVARHAQRTLVPLCERYDAAAIAFSTTGRGLLTGAFAGRDDPPPFAPGDIRALDPLFQRERFDSGLRVAARLAEIGEQHGRTPVQVAIAWVLAQPRVLCALTGPSTVAHVEENVAASGWRFPEEALAELDGFLAQEDARLARAQQASVARILNEALPESPEKAFVDLVYAIETAILLSRVDEPAVLPVFQELFALRKRLDAEAASDLAAIQERLRALIPHGPEAPQAPPTSNIQHPTRSSHDGR